MTPEGPREQLRRLVKDERGKMVSVAARIVGDMAEAEDVLQDTLAAVLKRAGKIEIKDLAAYLYRAIHVNALKRRARRRRHASLEKVAEPAAPEREEAEFEIAPLELERALAGLPESQQAVIRMKYYVGLTFRQIGEMLSISTNTAASRARYAIEAMREALDVIPRGKRKR